MTDKPSLRLFIILLTLTYQSSIMANDYPYVYQKTIVNKPIVINRIVSIKPVNKNENTDVDGIIAEARALEMALQAIPGIDNDLKAPQWKKFRFNNNMGQYQQPIKSKQQNRTIISEVRKIHTGVVDISYYIDENGVVRFD